MISPEMGWLSSCLRFLLIKSGFDRHRILGSISRHAEWQLCGTVAEYRMTNSVENIGLSVIAKS